MTDGQGGAQETEGGLERPAGLVGRRTVLAGVAGIAAATTLAACGSSSSGGTAAGAATGAASASSAGSAAATPDDKGGSSGGGSGAAGAALVDLSAVPVGGAVSAQGADGKPLVVSQPTAGTVVCFSAKCTHQGCTVAPAGKTFQCPCHGSVFDAATGKNVSGPAPRPLAEVPVKVADGKVVLA
ncbi:MAG TPA: Rieske (2Fe-2S) protein [Motilibacteraceae bacterium]|nr:Rieske (2Fe-2S) protein [Motilibacteraceae bacterium]